MKRSPYLDYDYAAVQRRIRLEHMQAEKETRRLSVIVAFVVAGGLALLAYLHG